VLLEFPSMVVAVECAVAFQALMAERNKGVPEDRRMLYRVGINLGDILIEDDDILGDGVNVAALLERHSHLRLPPPYKATVAADPFQWEGQRKAIRHYAWSDHVQFSASLGELTDQA
jgi:class 3 adenylate cyclase